MMINRVYHSVKDAKQQVSIWKAQYPNAQFKIVPYALGNKVAYQIVQINRFKDS